MSFHTRVEGESIDQPKEEGEREAEAERGDRDIKKKDGEVTRDRERL